MTRFLRMIFAKESLWTETCSKKDRTSIRDKQAIINIGSHGCIRDKRSGPKIDGKQGYFQRYQYIEKKSV